MNKSHLLGAACAFTLSLSFANSAIASIVNVDYGTLVSAYSGQGALGAGGTNWTRVGVSVSSPIISLNLADSNSVATGIDAILAVTSQFASVNTNSGNQLTKDAARLALAGGNQGTLTLSDLNPSSTYNLILYGVTHSLIFDGSRISNGSTFTVGGVSKTTSGDLVGVVGGFAEGQTHVTYTGLTADINNEIQVAITENNQANFAYLNGFQLKEITAVPVPAAAWLFGSGVLGLVGIARRKKAA